MERHWDSFMNIGLVHFMAYPETIKGEGPILETLIEICKDDFFTAIEISWIKDKKIKEEAKKVLESSHLTITYGAQPRLLINKLDLNSLCLKERKEAVEDVKRGIEEAAEFFQPFLIIYFVSRACFEMSF